MVVNASKQEKKAAKRAAHLESRAQRRTTVASHTADKLLDSKPPRHINAVWFCGLATTCAIWMPMPALAFALAIHTAFAYFTDDTNDLIFLGRWKIVLDTILKVLTAIAAYPSLKPAAPGAASAPALVSLVLTIILPWAALMLLGTCGLRKYALITSERFKNIVNPERTRRR